MKQLARTLLILGSVTACERAHPESEPRVQRPEPKPAAIAVPLVDHHGAPAVGNIGQTGAPKTVERPPRRVQRVVRAVRPAQPPPAPALQIQAEVQPAAANPLLDARRRPAVGNMGRAGGMRHREYEAEEPRRAEASEREASRR